MQQIRCLQAENRNYEKIFSYNSYFVKNIHEKFHAKNMEVAFSKLELEIIALRKRIN